MTGYLAAHNALGKVKKTTIKRLHAMKQNGEKSVMLTAYDASFANIIDQCGIEMVLVGDSLGMVIQGHETTLPVTMEHMVYHTSCVARTCHNALLIADLPFMSYCNISQALTNAARLMQEGGARAVKLESGAAQTEIIAALSQQGIPVCAHLGLRPQSVHKLSGYRVQGRDVAQAKAMLDEALMFEQAGADLLLLECVPAGLAGQISQRLTIPVIGIGAGVFTDGQVLVLQDVLGITVGKMPKFSKNFMAEAQSIEAAIRAYQQAVKSAVFPASEHSF